MTIYSVDVDELVPAEKFEVSLNQKNKTLTIRSENGSTNRTIYINSHKNQTIYTDSFLNQQKTIQLNEITKGVYSLEITSHNNRVVKEFTIK